jgi:hypothetical protein
MTSCTPRNGRDRCRTTHTLAICMQPVTTTLPKRAYSQEGVLPSAKAETRDRQSQENASRAQTLSRRSRTLPAVTPGVGLTSTRHVRDTVESTPPGKCSVEVEERTRGSRMPGTRMRYARDMRFARLRMQGRNPFLLQFCAAGAFLLSVPFGPSGCLYVF